MRICSLLPSATEIAFALGLGDSVVGVTHECDYPPEATKIPSVVKSAIDPDTTNSGNYDPGHPSGIEGGRICNINSQFTSKGRGGAICN